MIGPLNFELSVPPKVNSPFSATTEVVGLNEIPIWFVVMTPCEKRLSVTVGIKLFVLGLRVPSVSETGPMLYDRYYSG